jgi:hypothetical protein
VYCTKCGSEISPTTAFCATCGQVVPGAVTTLPSLSPVVVGPPAPIVPASVSYGGVTYAGFWLRFVAYIIDGFISCFAFAILLIPLFVLTGAGAALGRIISNGDIGDDMGAFLGAGFLLGFFGIVLVVSWLYYARHAGEEDPQLEGHGSDRAAHHVCPRIGTVLREDHYGHDSVRDRLHHGWFHGEKAGYSRHDRELSGLAQSLALCFGLTSGMPLVGQPPTQAWRTDSIGSARIHGRAAEYAVNRVIPPIVSATASNTNHSTV